MGDQPRPPIARVANLVGGAWFTLLALLTFGWCLWMRPSFLWDFRDFGSALPAHADIILGVVPMVLLIVLNALQIGGFVASQSPPARLAITLASVLITAVVTGIFIAALCTPFRSLMGRPFAPACWDALPEMGRILLRGP